MVPSPSKSVSKLSQKRPLRLLVCRMKWITMFCFPINIVNHYVPEFLLVGSTEMAAAKRFHFPFPHPPLFDAYFLTVTDSQFTVSAL